MNKFILILSLLFLVACQRNGLNRVVTAEKVSAFKKLEIPENQSLISIPLVNFEHASFHNILLKNAEKPHIHAKHDLAVYVLKGSSWIYLNDKRIELFPGDFIVIPRGTVHWAINTGKDPAEVLAVFSPPFDGKDIVPVAETKPPEKE